MRRLIIILLISLAVASVATAETLEGYLKNHGSEIADGFDITDIATTAAGNRDIVGVWAMRFDGDSGLFALVRDPYTGFLKMIVVDAACRSVRPGTLMGVMRQVAATDTYEARIFSSVDPKGRLSNPKQFTLHLTADNALTFKPVSKRWIANWWRLIPYMGRISVRRVDDEDKGINGAVRVIPPSKASSDGPHLL